MSGKDDRYFGIVLEEIRSQNKLILEAVGAMQEHVSKIPKMQEDITDLKQDTTMLKAALTDTNKDLRKLQKQSAKQSESIDKQSNGITELKTDMKIVKAAVTDNGTGLQKLGHRVDQLEARA